MSSPLSSLEPGTSSSLDVFHRSTAVVKSWFKTWLSNSTSQYYTYPISIVSQGIYAMSMLCRWAKYAVPRSLYALRGPVQPEAPSNRPKPSSRGSQNLTAIEDAGSVNTQTGSSNGSSTITVFTSQMEHHNTYSMDCPDDLEPGLRKAIATLKAKISSQLDLGLDMLEIMVEAGAKADQANTGLIEAAAESGAWDNGFWALCALKVRITTIKLAHWAEMIENGPIKSMGGPSDYQGGSRNINEEIWAGRINECAHPNSTDMAGVSHKQVPLCVPPDPQESYSPWPSDLFGDDPMFWFDGWGRLDATTMNSTAQ